MKDDHSYKDLKVKNKPIRRCGVEVGLVVERGWDGGYKKFQGLL
jgi:hypothetical protein